MEDGLSRVARAGVCHSERSEESQPLMTIPRARNARPTLFHLTSYITYSLNPTEILTRGDPRGRHTGEKNKKEGH
jgi:hypothetical protein